ncbi:hypothetical protein KEJ33_05240 [Candidatus Bathyarchaeota archaeon]|nr:hypothetical protein [Candidatus Bathyarchaeota archaeon]
MVSFEGNEKIIERAILLKRAFSIADLFIIGKELKIPYVDGLSNEWEIKDEDEIAFSIAEKIDDNMLKDIFIRHNPRKWAIFRGIYYMLEDGKISNESIIKIIENGIRRARVQYGSQVDLILKIILKSHGVISLDELEKQVRISNLFEVLDYLEKLKIVVSSYKGEKYQEWMVLEETIPILEFEFGIRKKLPGQTQHVLDQKIQKQTPLISGLENEGSDYLIEEKKRVQEMDREFDEYLMDVLKNRLEHTLKFGEEFGLGYLSKYLQDLFGQVLYFDSLLSITQQYGLANIEIIHEHGGTGKRTGWSLALFGDPGTGKSFSTRDMILGSPRAKVGAHGIPGRNRYCGGITPARFIRIGQAYSGKVFNFIVPEFNDFFRYKGMVEPLKIAMEQGEIKYETHAEVIGPYRFTSFFSVNYNVSVYKQGYKVTIQDPNFNAIEDRMLCRLHRLTKERFIELTKSQMKLALGDIDIEKDAQKIRDHLTLVYAIETGHPLVKNRFKYKPIMITPRVFNIITKARAAILKRIPQDIVKFSARLEDKAIRFAAAASLMEYFRSNKNFIPISEDALKFATQLYVEEASVRSEETFEPREVLREVFE